MKGMPSPFDFEGKGVLDLELLVKNKSFFTTQTETPAAFSPPLLKKDHIFSTNTSSFVEPTSVLDSSRLSSCSSLVAADSDNAVGGGGADWDSVLSDSVAGEQSGLRWIMGDVEDNVVMGSLNRVLQIGGGYGGGGCELINGGFGVVEPGFSGGVGGVGDQFGGNFVAPMLFNGNRSSSEKIGLASNVSGESQNVSGTTFPVSFSNSLGHNYVQHHTAFESLSSQMMINQNQVNQTQNPAFYVPISNAQPQLLQEDISNVFVPPPAKRHNPGRVGPFSEMGSQDIFMGRQQHLVLPNYLQQMPIGPGHKPKMEGVDDGNRQAIIDHLFKAAEVIQTGNSLLAQEILARLNHQLSPIGKPFQRAAFYCKEALETLVHSNNSNNSLNRSTTSSSPFSLIYKIGAYKSFSEVSPLVQFANFTCTQILLEAFEGFDRIHILDFDIGYGGQWASFMQELALRSGGAPSLKITALASPTTHDQIELGLARENLIQFARESNIVFEFGVMNIDYLDSGSCSLPFQLSENEAVGVNLPVACLTTYQVLVPSIFRFLKQLSLRIVVSIDRGCDRTDLPFANHIIHALQSYSNLLESLDAVNMNMDALQKIERFFLQPGIEKIVMARFRCPETTQHWRTTFLSSGLGLSPVTFSNFTESQAECIVKKTPIGGFQVEKRQSSLVLCWQRKELVSVSAWRC